MIRPLALLLCLAGDASAQDRAEWPSDHIGMGWVQLAPSGDEYTVTLHNVSTVREWGDDLSVYVLSVDGMRVVVQIWLAEGMAPDTLVVFAPPGWLAIPPTLDVGELQTGAVRIVMEKTS